MPTTTFKTSSSGSFDSALSSGNPQGNYGGSNPLSIDLDNGFSAVFGFLMDASSVITGDPIPSGAVITAASLTLNVTVCTGSDPLEFRRIHSQTIDYDSIEEGTGTGGITGDGMTYNEASPGVSWTTPGALDDTEAGTAVTGAMPGNGVTGSRTFTGFSDMDQDGFDSSSQALAILLRVTSGTATMIFSSGEDGTAANQPTLTVEWKPPPGPRGRSTVRGYSVRGRV